LIRQFDINRDWRKARLFGPIVALTLGVLLLLVLTTGFLIQRFDQTASDREQHMVEHGFTRQAAELSEVVATQVGWDDAVLMLDHRRDQDWADFSVGNYLHTFNGFTHSFVIDGDAQVFYASVDGARAGLEQYQPFSGTAAALLPAVRMAESRRPALGRRPGKDNLLVPAIQSYTVTRVNNQVFLVIATLVQPDFGKYLPKGPRAPVTITAKPLDNAFLGTFGQRYLLDELQVLRPGAEIGNSGSLVLRDTAMQGVATLVWTPRKPGSLLLGQLLLPLLGVMALLGLTAWTVVRRSGRIVTDLIASEARAKHLAFHDPLTRLPNRAMLFERLRSYLAALNGTGGQVMLLCVDLDRFKEINDSLGHHAGDLVIETMAQRLRSVCAQTGLIARLGGDEFVVLCNTADAAAAAALGQQILHAVSRPVQSEYGQFEMSCSIGAAIIDQAGVEPTEALRWADLALYRSKDLGRNQLTFFEAEMDLALRNRRSLEADLRDALAQNLLRMEYQPQVDIGGRIIAAEALLRWHHPTRGEIPPGTFVPLAEETGLILPLGEFVLRRVFEETGDWRRTRVAINVSAEQMRAPGFAGLVARLAARAGVDPARYELELTETALLTDEPETIANITALKGLGFSIALDDFGTGYSSLSVLQRFSVDKIKIDHSFVSCIEDGGESEALVDAMIKLARALDLRVIAEGVESEEQRDRLTLCGCTEFQGFLTGRPMPAGDVAKLVGEALDLPQRAVNRRG
jgi:diguanylate cyclase (GGDEF)-like protein